MEDSGPGLPPPLTLESMRNSGDLQRLEVDFHAEQACAAMSPLLSKPAISSRALATSWHKRCSSCWMRGALKPAPVQIPAGTWRTTRPLFSSPIRLRFGTRTVVEENLVDLVVAGHGQDGRHAHPGLSMATSRKLIPCCGFAIARGAKPAENNGRRGARGWSRAWSR